MSDIIVETKRYEGRDLEVKWVPTPELPSGHVTQVSGICFRDDGKMLVIRGAGESWSLPGGKPEEGEEFEDTLRRELFEEAAVDISGPVLLGYQQVKYPENPNRAEGDLFCQLRFAARVVKIHPAHVDPAQGFVYERHWVKDLNRHLQWGRIGDALSERALVFFEELYQ